VILKRSKLQAPSEEKKAVKFAPSNPEKPIIFENPVAWVQKLANLCGPTQ
jgi:hypothetical protein